MRFLVVLLILAVCGVVAHPASPAELASYVYQNVDRRVLQAANLPMYEPLLLSTALQQVVRNRDFVELFAGTQGITNACRAAGLRGAPYDIIIDRAKMNFLNIVGKAQALLLVLSIAAGGFIWASPQCSSWIWMSRHHMRRTASHPEGDGTRRDVRDANDTVEFLVVLLRIGVMRAAQWCCEQPGTSVMFAMPAWASFIAWSGARRFWVWLGSYGANGLKPTILWGTWGPMKRLYRPKPTDFILTNSGWTRGRWVTGTSDLKSSEHFPTAFCQEIASLLADTCSRRTCGAIRALCRRQSAWALVFDSVKVGLRKGCGGQPAAMAAA